MQDPLVRVAAKRARNTFILESVCSPVWETLWMDFTNPVSLENSDQGLNRINEQKEA